MMSGKVARKEEMNIEKYDALVKIILDKLSGNLISTVDEIKANRFINELLEEKNQDKNIKYPALNRLYRKILQETKNLKNKEFYVGMAGDQSCGKSTLINSLIEYPLISQANVVTTAAGIIVRYSPFEYIKVGSFKKNQKEFIRNINKEVFLKVSAAFFEKLKQYFCLSQKVINLENVQFFTDEDLQAYSAEDKILETSKLDLDINNIKHVTMLLLTLLSTYIGQNDTSHADADVERIVEMRKELFSELNLNPSIDYIVEVGWNAKLLKEGVVLLDLPGLGSAVKESQNASDHNKLTERAIAQTDAIIFVMNEGGPSAQCKSILKGLINLAEIKHSLRSSDRINVVINKVDRINNAGINAILKRTKTELMDFGLKDAKILKYSALCANEYIYYKKQNIKYNRLEAVKRLDSQGFPCDEKSVENYIIGQYNKRSYHDEFTSYLNDYINKSSLIAYFSIIHDICQLEKDISDLLSKKVDYTKTILDNLEYVSKDNLDLLKTVLNGITFDFSEKLNDIVGQNIAALENKYESEVGIIATNAKISAEKEINERKSYLSNSVATLKKNWYNDIILKDRKGNEKYEYKELRTYIFNFKSGMFDITEQLISSKMVVLLEDLDYDINKLEKEIAYSFKNLENNFTNIWEGVKNVNREKLPLAYVEFLEKLSKHMKDILKQGKDSKKVLKSISLSEGEKYEMRENIIDEILKIKYKLKEGVEEAFDNQMRGTWIGKKAMDPNFFRDDINKIVPTDEMSDSTYNSVNELYGDISSHFTKYSKKINEKALEMGLEIAGRCDDVVGDAYVAYGAGKGESKSNLKRLKSNMEGLDNNFFRPTHKKIEEDIQALSGIEDKWINETREKIEEETRFDNKIAEAVKKADEIINGKSNA